MGKGGARERKEAFRVSGKRNVADFAPTRPPAAQEKAIAEAKALAEQN